MSHEPPDPFADAKDELLAEYQHKLAVETWRREVAEANVRKLAGVLLSFDSTVKIPVPPYVRTVSISIPAEDLLLAREALAALDEGQKP